MGDEIVRVSSHWSLWEAELVRGRLEAENIPARLGNASFVFWVWYYGNAVGGVTVLVSARDAEAARALLNPAHDEPAEGQSSWTCSMCGARGFSSWDVCWNCGVPADGAPSPGPGRDDATPPEAPIRARNVSSGLLGALVAMVLLAFFLAGGIVAFLAAASFVGLVVLGILAWNSGAAPQPTEDGVREPGRDAFGTPSEKRACLRNSIVERAWRASIFGLLAFPPLGLYSLWLLWRVFFRKTRLGRIDRARYILALIVDLAIPLGFVIWPAMLFFNW